ncbi:MAG: hypothetical protein HN704_12380 [Bacteroidetes bacterium]|jgi:gliding-associated putative ABC transporter substrate-binding component GldG|nr:hypothetical protein [Bacteroidota bacterium]MBT7144375.1 hypothetical protein [Bacteroidota bacterium]MBT7492390.1 hypothetical protein [Bacteroidota bacterium]
MKNKKSLSTYIIGILAIIILVNILSDYFFVRLDLTEDNRYTMSQATKDILENLEEPVTITAYFSEDLPPDIAKTRRAFKEILIEFGSLSGGMVVYEFIDPKKDKETEQKAMQAGVQPVLVNVREKDKVEQQRVFLGAVISLGEESDVIPFMKPGAAMEYALSSSIKKLSISEKPLVGLLQGHGEASLASLQQVRSGLSILYNAEEVSLSDTSSNLDKYQSIAIVAPTDSFPQSHFAQLDNFLAKGGNLFIAFNRVEMDLTTNQGKTVETNFDAWLTQKGLTVENNFVIDLNCARATVPQRFGNFTMQAQVLFPYVPIISNFQEHPITKGLEAAMLEYVSSITFTGDTSMQFTPLLKTSKNSATLSCPIYIDVQKKWDKNRDFTLPNITIGGVLEGNIAGNTHSKIVLIADGNFPVNGEGNTYKKLQNDNVSLMVNSIDWLSDETGLIELRTKGVSARPLDEVEDGKKVFLKWFNFLFPIILIIVIGFVKAQMRRNVRIKRMEEGYI